MSATTITGTAKETTAPLARRIKSPYTKHMDKLPEVFKTRLKDLLRTINLPIPKDAAIQAFLIPSTVELAPTLRNPQDVENLVVNIGRFLESSIPLSDLTAHKVGIMPRKCAALIQSTAACTPEEMRSRIFSKDFREFSAADLKELYDQFTDEKQRKSIIQMALGIAYAQAISNLWAEAQPTIAPSLLTQKLRRAETTEKAARSSPSTIPNQRERNDNPVTLNVRFSCQKHKEALSDLAAILTGYRQLVPTAQRSVKCWETWPRITPSPDSSRAEECELKVHPADVDLITRTAKTLLENSGAFKQLVHLNRCLREVTPREPYYNGAKPPQETGRHHPSAYQFCYL